LYDQSMALASTAEGKALMGAESAISESVLNCQSAEAQIRGLIGGISVLQNSGDTSVRVRLTDPNGGNASHDRSLGPFDGFVPGDLNLQLSVSVAGSDSAVVEYGSIYSVPAHLPARVQSAMGDCIVAASYVESALSSTNLHGCNATMARSLMQQASSKATALAARDDFVFGLSYSVANQGACVVSFTVAMDQVAIDGPEGTFSLRLRQSGSVSFGGST
jgi:hypothetical protein